MIVPKILGSHPQPTPPFNPAVEPWESQEAIRRIAAALPPLERAYALVRFAIFRTKFLAMMNLVLPERGRLLDVGCGFGLFSVYFAMTSPHRVIRGSFSTRPNGSATVSINGPTWNSPRTSDFTG